MMRIAYVCADPGVPIFGRKGCSIHVQEVVRAFRRLGMQVELFAARMGNQPPADLADIPVTHFPLLPTDNLRERECRLVAANQAFTRALTKARPFDVIYERFSLWSHAAMDAARSTGAVGLVEVNAPLIDEQATYRGLTNRPEVRVVAIAFGGIAAVAKRLEIFNRINSAMFSWLDVIDLQSSLVGRNSTQFTMELCPLQNLIPKASRNVS